MEFAILYKILVESPAYAQFKIKKAPCTPYQGEHIRNALAGLGFVGAIHDMLGLTKHARHRLESCELQT
eukprot:706934-Pelagomonas_calceolata.AAC.2